MAESDRGPRAANIAKTVVTAGLIAATALSAGGIFCYPLIAGPLSDHLKLTQPQLSTIALAGMSGQYPFAAFFGELVDRYGPWITSLSASVLYATGFGLFSYEISQNPSPEQSSAPFRRLVASFFLCGLATAASLFTVLFSASQAFPGHTGISAGFSTAFFGLSPLVLSLIASSFFSPDGELDITHFLLFLAIITGLIHAFGAIFFRIFPPTVITPLEHPEDTAIENPVPTLHPHERTPLLNDTDTTNKTHSTISALDREQSVSELLHQADFWLLALSMLLLLGSCEMVISNIGTIILGVPIGNGLHSAAASTSATQVRLISVSNTISRLVVGPVADYLAPTGLVHSNGELYFPRKRYLSRLAILCLPAAVMSVAYLWMAAGVRTQYHIYLVSMATGASYGTAFTILPSIVASLWVGKNASRNFGIVIYAPFLGTPIFSYLYAFVAAARKDGDGVCKGVHCWQPTFWFATIASVLSFFMILSLWRRSRAHV